MPSRLENLIYVEVGAQRVWEADLQDQRIRVVCVYEAHSESWSYDVFIVGAAGLRRLTESPTLRRNTTQSGAVDQGMKMGIDAILRA